MKRLLLFAALSAAAAAAPAALAQRTPPLDYLIDDTQPPPVSRRVTPTYPDAARRDSVESHIILKVLVRADGAVETTELLRQTETRNGVTLPLCNPYARIFAAAASEAVRQWHFSPTRYRRNPVDVWVTVPMRLRHNR